ncbi:RpiB/LacA/LacB family sugar-phosphate isomerase [Brachybacterium sp. J144]|jgi:ribose 5-phosphate isomerase B|uniref:RpiB/LacA/LacB family sugar-phosphate isomerase n=1 Tax=Brachybacterium sp. J144 TaxID=3116487 RepID=UPI002BB2F55C|nr:RpiB/LacA/LacB family sugar-phosphate isomerase [Brachybacterium sp. J144]MEE1652198.1 RpiB/LacA/LacB family sugar-phosphate isomerase [Brachybacterium sp. J144]HRA09685.1 RpiB/LacA/LacB family sugar-phosphate isomerase [Microbacteriaceae bacterium]
MLIGIGCDPNATTLKDAVADYLRELGHEVRDFGSDDPLYSKTAIAVAESVAAKEVERGVVMCGTGIGVSISANKVPGAYCALLTDAYQAERAQLSNDANMVAFGAQVTGVESVKRLVREYLSVSYVENERSAPKLAALYDYETESTRV